MLAEKYRPRTFKTLLGNESVKERVKEWIEAWLSGKRQKPLLLYGPVGVGKTSLAYIVAHQYSLDVLSFSASDKRDKSLFQKLSLASKSTTSLFGNKKLIILDDLEGLTREDRGAMGGIAELIKNSSVPIIMTVNDPWDKKVSSLRGKVELLHMKRLAPSQIRKLLLFIAHKEGIEVESSFIDDTIQRANGDVRSAINDLESLMLGYRDRKNDIFAVMKAIFKATDLSWPRSTMVSADVDIDMIKAWVDENIALEYEDVGDVARAYSYLSRADVFQGRIMKRQYWGLLRYVSVLVAAVALAKKEPYRKFTKYNYPSYIKEMYKTVARRAKIRAISKKIGKRIHLSPKEVAKDIAFYARIIKRGKEHAKVYYKLDDEEFKFLSTMA
ncbi:MAG: replication factor C large subunit [Methanobacteriota archaeon]|nr:MAG: replication factor C large subunit [Euryarchaeota archaeon]